MVIAKKSKIGLSVLDVIEIARRLVMDTVLLLLCMNLFYPLFTLNQSWTLFFNYPVLSCIPLLLFKRDGQLKIRFIFIVVSLSGFILGLLFREPLLLNLLMTAFIQWRLYSIIKEDLTEDDDSESKKILIACILALINYICSFFLKADIGMTPLLFILIQVFLYTFGSFIKKYYTYGSIVKRNVTDAVIWIMIVPVAAAGILLLVCIALRMPVSDLLSLLFKKFVYSTGTILAMLIHFFSLKRDKVGSLMKKGNMKMDNKDDRHDQDHDFLVNSGIWDIVLAVIFMILIIWLIVKIRKWSSSQMESIKRSGLRIVNTRLSKEEEDSLYLNDPGYSKASSIVRKKMKELERYAFMMKLGRLEFESVEEWLKRIGLSHKHEWMDIYEKARYGNRQVSNKELDYFTKENSKLKQGMKATKKGIVKKRK